MRDYAETRTAERPLKDALLRGWRGRCPECGGGHLYDGYLKVRPSCEFCGETFSHHRADDAPAWLTILLIGHLIAPLVLSAYELFDLPVWAHAVIWPSLAMLGVVVLLPRVKGAVIAFQWSHRMHGFDKPNDRSDR